MIKSHIQKIPSPQVDKDRRTRTSNSRTPTKKQRIFKYRKLSEEQPVHSSNSKLPMNFQFKPNLFDARTIKSDQFKGSYVSNGVQNNTTLIQRLYEPKDNLRENSRFHRIFHELPTSARPVNQIRISNHKNERQSHLTPVKFSYVNPSPVEQKNQIRNSNYTVGYPPIASPTSTRLSVPTFPPLNIQAGSNISASSSNKNYHLIAQPQPQYHPPLQVYSSQIVDTNPGLIRTAPHIINNVIPSSMFNQPQIVSPPQVSAPTPTFITVQRPINYPIQYYQNSTPMPPTPPFQNPPLITYSQARPPYPSLTPHSHILSSQPQPQPHQNPRKYSAESQQKPQQNQKNSSNYTITRDDRIKISQTKKQSGSRNSSSRYFDSNARLPVRKLDTLGVVVEEIARKKKQDPESLYQTWNMKKDMRNGTDCIKEELQMEHKFISFKQLGNANKNPQNQQHLDNSISPPMLKQCQQDDLSISTIKQTKQQQNQSQSYIQVPSPTINPNSNPNPNPKSRSRSSSSTAKPPSSLFMKSGNQGQSWELRDLVTIVVLIGLGVLLIMYQICR